jgi:hypothetical protein
VMGEWLAVLLESWVGVSNKLTRGFKFKFVRPKIKSALSHRLSWSESDLFRIREGMDQFAVLDSLLQGVPIIRIE